jgi:hypothetical protein
MRIPLLIVGVNRTNFSSKVNMPRCINNIDLIAFPLCRNSRGNNGNTTFAFLNHPVGYCCAIVNRTDAMCHARIEHNTLSGCCFSGVNVGNNAYISVFIQRVLACHTNYILKRYY